MSTVTFAQDNAIKLRVGSLLIGTTYLEYERALNDKSSVTGAIHYSKAHVNQIQNAFKTNGTDDGVFDLATPTLSGYGVTFEYRMYPSKKKEGLSGFYFAPFLRHSQYSIELESVFAQDNGDEYVGKIKLTLQNTIGLGASIGTHFNAGKHISIDVTWIGLGVSMSKMKGEITTNDKTVDFRESGEDIAKEVEENKYLSSYKLTQNKATINSTNTILPILRSNVSIGYRF